MDELGRVSVDAFKLQEKLGVTLILDNVRSLHNVGSVFRTADGFAAEGIVLCGITGTPPHREIEKTALGATSSVTWSYEKDILSAIRQLKDSGYRVIALEQAEGSTPLHEFQPTPGEKYALILGNEVNGVSAEAMECVDDCIEIPQFGTKHSFNVVVSAGIVLWDFYSKLLLQG